MCVAVQTRAQGLCNCARPPARPLAHPPTRPPTTRAQMFDYDPAKRVNAKDAMSHPYFDDLDKETVDLLENEALRTRD